MTHLFKKMADRQVDDLTKLVGLDIDMSVHEEMKLSTLHYAAWYNMDTAVEELISLGADVMELDSDRATPLHYAARYKQRIFGDAGPASQPQSEDEDDKILKEETMEMVKKDKKDADAMKGSRDALDEVGKDGQKAAGSAVATIEHLLKAGAQVNARDDYGTTALFYAVLRGNIHAVRILLEQPDIDISSEDNRKLSTLHIAAKYLNRVEIAELLLDKGVDIMLKDETGFTPMHIAAMEGNLEIVKLLIRRSGSPEEKSMIVNALTARKESPLDFAIESKHKAVFEELLPHAKIRRTCRPTHYTPLHLATISGTPGMVRMLLEKDLVLVNMRSSDQATALHKAAQFNRPRIAKNLLDRNAGLEATDSEKQTPLLVAAAHGSDRTLNVLLDKGAKLRALTNKEQNIIHLIVKNNRPGTLEIVINYIRKKLSEKTMVEMINADDRIGNSPLHISADLGFVEVTKILMDNGANLQDLNEDEETPLHMASNKGHLGVVEELLRFDKEQSTKDSVIIHDEDEDGNTALHLAASHGHTRVCKILIQNGADMDNSNRNLWPPLFSAVVSGDVDTVRALLNSTELHWQDRNKETCLHLAAKLGHVGVAELLLQNKVPISGINGNGHNPLDLAINFGHKDVVMLFLSSDQWKDALRNRTLVHGAYKDIQTTPLRNLIQKMPDCAEKVLDRCVSYPPGVEITDPELNLEFDFEVIDDTYTAAHWGNPDLHDDFIFNTSNKTYDALGRLLPSAFTYAKSNLERKENHPLTHMVKYGRSDLLHHPVCLALIKQKWQLANIFFILFVLFYGTYTAVFTSFMVSSKPPYLLNSSMFLPQNVNACREVLREGAATRWYLVTPEKGHAIVYIVCLMAIIGISVEAFQLYNARRKYLKEPTNLLDWFSYISAIAVVVPATACGVRTHWQWQLGCACFFIMWINTIMFLRRTPTMGLYIVMVGEVFVTFIRFFVFCFSLFLLAYGFTFFLLLQNDPQFSTLGYSFVKTTVMMIGELDYGDMFHGEDGDDSDETHLVTYEFMSFALFLTFLCMVTIVIMNLLTGLAVGDVQMVQQSAALKKLALQVDLALDVECSMPEKLRRRLRCVLRTYVIRPNKASSNFLNRLGMQLAGPMSAKEIASAVYAEYEEDLEEERMRKRDAEESGGDPRRRTQGGAGRLVGAVHDQEQQIIQLRDQMKKMEGMMRRCLDLLREQQPGKREPPQDGAEQQSPPPPPPSYPPPMSPQPDRQQLFAIQPSPATQSVSLPNLGHIPYIDDPHA